MDCIKIKEELLKNTEGFLCKFIDEIEKKDAELNQLKNIIEIQNKEIIKLKQKIRNLEQNNINQVTNKVTCKDELEILNIRSYIIELLSIYFIQDKSKCVKLLEDILKEKSIFTDDFEKSNGFNLLYIALILGEDSRVIDRFNSICELLDAEEWEGELYKRFYDLQSEPNIQDAIDFIKLARNVKFKYIFNDIEAQVRNYLKNSILNTLLDKVRMEEDISLISMKKLKCTYDGSELERKMIFLKYYSKNNKKKAIGAVDTEAFVCKTCGRVYLTDEQIKKIKIGDNKLKQVSYQKPTPKNLLRTNLKKPIVNHQNAYSNSITQINSTSQNKITKATYENISLNDKSKLGALGYSTGLSREERWHILKNKAIPELGLERTKYI